MDAKTLIRHLGGQKRLSQALGLKVFRINGWALRNKLPAEFYLAIWKLCLDRGIDWKPPGAAEIEMKIFEHHANSLVKTFATGGQSDPVSTSREAA